MIRALDNIAWVKLEDGRLAPFDEHELANSIQDAAARIGDADWWLAESIAAAVHAYAVKCRSDHIIDSGEIDDIVVTVLSMLGFKDLSRAFAKKQSHAEIRLVDLVPEVGTAFELDFFRQLDRALSAAADRQLSVLEIVGLRGCVMHLRGAQRWSEGCRQFAEEIVAYVRERVVRMRPVQAVRLQLAVVE